MDENFTTSAKLVELILTLSKFLYLLSATLVIGQVLAAIFFAKNQQGTIENSDLPILKKASNYAWIWAGATALFIVATLASVLEVGIGQVLDFTMLRSFITQISLGKFLTFQLIGAIVVAITARIATRITTATMILIIAFSALSAPIFQSHSASGGSHLVAIGTLLVHVIAKIGRAHV